MSTWDALYASLVSLRTVAGRKAIVLLSDGVDDDGTGKPLSKKTGTDVLALARQVNVPIYAIGLGTELDEINLKKVATDSGALYLNAADPAELKRLYDSIGKQLAAEGKQKRVTGMARYPASSWKGAAARALFQPS